MDDDFKESFIKTNNWGIFDSRISQNIVMICVCDK